MDIGRNDFIHFLTVDSGFSLSVPPHRHDTGSIHSRKVSDKLPALSKSRLANQWAYRNTRDKLAACRTFVCRENE